MTQILKGKEAEQFLNKIQQLKKKPPKPNKADKYFSKVMALEKGELLDITGDCCDLYDHWNTDIYFFSPPASNSITGAAVQDKTCGQIEKYGQMNGKRVWRTCETFETLRGKVFAGNPRKFGSTHVNGLVAIWRKQ